jgi:hypothetical protein
MEHNSDGDQHVNEMPGKLCDDFSVCQSIMMIGSIDCEVYE